AHPPQRPRRAARRRRPRPPRRRARRVARPAAPHRGRLPARRLARRALAPSRRTARAAPGPARGGGEPARRRRQHRRRRRGEGGARRLHHSHRRRRHLGDQPVPVFPDALLGRARPAPALHRLGVPERRGGARAARAGAHAPRVHRLGQGAASGHQLRLARRRHHAAPLGRAAHGARWHQGRARAFPRRGANHPRHALGRRAVRPRQPRLLRPRHPGRADARARRHRRRTLAEPARRADDAGSGDGRLRRHLLDQLRRARRHAAPGRGPPQRGAARDLRRPRAAPAGADHRRQAARLHAGGSAGAGRGRDPEVARDGPHLRRAGGV
ncbi:MAG: BUG/TctC family periplasmic protein, partial [uncultured Acetobacteraceae bacterium]